MLWESHNLTEYTMELRFHCFCFLATPEPIRVVVEDGKIVAASDVQTGEEVPPGRSGSWDWPTVSELLDRIRHAYDEGERVMAEYDRHFGHPTRATIGEPERDAGYTMLVDSLDP